MIDWRRISWQFVWDAIWVQCAECSVQCAECAHIDRVGSSAQLPDLILILILNFMPQLRLDFLAGNQSAAAAVAALAVALVAALLPSKLRQFDTLETCILAASLATHCAAAPPALCGQLSLTFRERRFATGATRPCPASASATASAPAPVSPVPQFQFQFPQSQSPTLCCNIRTDLDQPG